MWKQNIYVGDGLLVQRATSPKVDLLVRKDTSPKVH